MKEEELFEDISKNLPYSESEEYLDDLMDRVVEASLKQQGVVRGKKHWGMMLASAAAVMLLVFGIGFTVLKNGNHQQIADLQSSGPIDEFLSSLTDEEVAQLPYYEIEEIPEY